MNKTQKYIKSEIEKELNKDIEDNEIIGSFLHYLGIQKENLGENEKAFRTIVYLLSSILCGENYEEERWKVLTNTANKRLKEINNKEE